MLGLLWMPAHVLETLRGYSFNPPHRPSPLRVTQYVPITNGKIDVLRKSVDEPMRFGERCAALEDK